MRPTNEEKPIVVFMDYAMDVFMFVLCFVCLVCSVVQTYDMLTINSCFFV